MRSWSVAHSSPLDVFPGQEQRKGTRALFRESGSMLDLRTDWQMSVRAGETQANASKNRLGGAALRQMVVNRIIVGAAIRHQHKDRKLIALGKRHHASSHAEHTRILNKKCGAYTTEPEAACYRESLLFVGCSYQGHVWLL